MIYTSPLTGKNYQIIETHHTRNGWDENGNLKPYDQVIYEIYDQEVNVSFAVSEKSIATVIQHLENPGPDISSPRD